MSYFATGTAIFIILGLLMLMISTIIDFVLVDEDGGNGDSYKAAAIIQIIAIILFIVAGAFAVITATAFLGKWADNYMEDSQTSAKMKAVINKGKGMIPQGNAQGNAQGNQNGGGALDKISQAADLVNNVSSVGSSLSSSSGEYITPSNSVNVVTSALEDFA